MRPEGCVIRDDMEIRGISCMLYVHKHRDTSSETMSPDEYSMLMREGVHGKHDTKGFR